VKNVSPNRWSVIQTGHQWHDDKVYLKRRRHPVLREIHNGVCGAHSSWHSIDGKAFRHEFYWPTVKDDAMEIVTKCKECQFFQKQTTKHVNPLRLIDLSWPFAVWGIDIISVLLRAPGGFRFLFVVIDTFTKWMEATPVINITQEATVKFLQSIIYRFGVPQRVLTVVHSISA
jgi:hypothetical protein